MQASMMDPTLGTVGAVSTTADATRVSSPTAETAGSKPEQSRFESGETHGALAQMVEASGLDPDQ